MYGMISEQITPGKLVFLAAAIQAAALLFQGPLRIRILLLIGSVVYLFYYTIAAKEPLWEAIIATSAMSIANIYGLAKYYLDKMYRFIPTNQITLFSLFGEILPGEFKSLMKHGQIRKLSEEEILTRVGEVPDYLYFIIDGVIEIEQGSGRFFIPARHFIGEVSLLLNTTASATVRVKPGAQIVQWPRGELIQNMTRSPKMKVIMESLLSRDMAKKVAAGAGRVDNRFVSVDPTSAILL